MTTIFKYSWGPILFEYFHYRCYNISTTFYKQCWYKYLCTICLILQQAVAANNHICLKTWIWISWEYLFQNINTNILGIFVRKYEYEYLGNICLKLNYSERWPRRLKRLERRGQRRSRSFVSPSRFFFLFACIWFVFYFLFAFATSSFAIFFKLESTGKGDLGHLFLPRSFSFVSPARFFFLCFVIFNLCLFLFVCYFCRYLQHYPLFLPQCFFLFFLFLSIYLYLRHHHLFKLENPGKRRSRSQVWDNRWYLREITNNFANTKK